MQKIYRPVLTTHTITLNLLLELDLTIIPFLFLQVSAPDRHTSGRARKPDPHLLWPKHGLVLRFTGIVNITTALDPARDIILATCEFI